MKAPKKADPLGGFSLIEILIASALMVALAVGLTQMIMGAMKGQKNVQNAVDFDLIKSGLNLLLNTKSCDGAFKKDTLGNNVGLTFSVALTGSTDIITTPVPIVQIKHGNSTIIDMTKPQIGGGLTLSKLEFVSAVYDGDQSVTDTSTPPITTVYKAFSARIKLEATKSTGSLGNQTLASPLLMVRILVKPGGVGGTVDRCGTSSSSSKGRDSCPTGYSLVGNVGDLSAFCISTVRRTQKTFLNAIGDCANEPIPANICGMQQWELACVRRASAVPPITQPMIGAGGAVEWLGDQAEFAKGYGIAAENSSAGATTSVSAPLSCDAASVYYELGWTEKYRCCF